MLTVTMSNLTDKRCFKTNNSDKTMQLSSVKRSELFSDRNTNFESSCLTRKSVMHTQMNQLFKVPNFDNLPVKKATVKSIRSPLRKVQTGRIKNDLKSGQQPKMSLIPRPSFINTRKSLHSSRSTQLNARKELIKKMVYLAECALNENKEVKKSTPVKMLAGLTPKKTPRSGAYFILPEFQKKSKKLEDIKSPIEDFIKKEMFSYSAKAAPIFERKIECNAIKPTAEEAKQPSFKSPKEEIKTETQTLSDVGRFTHILHQCKMYHTEIGFIHNKLKALDDSFEQKLQLVPDYRIYNEFCSYQSKKHEIYKEIQTVEEDLKNFIETHTNFGQKLKSYINKKREFFEKQVNLHRDFEQVISSSLAKCQPVSAEEKQSEKAKEGKETPKLRRSLRLSKIKKSKFEEKTPMTKKLKKLDSKSKGILKSGKV